MVENKNSITLNEFKAWLVGLIRGKNGDLPNLEDWKEIKTMLDKVKAEKIIVKENDPFFPYVPQPYQPNEYKWGIKWTNDTNPYTIGVTYTNSKTDEYLDLSQPIDQVTAWKDLFEDWT